MEASANRPMTLTTRVLSRCRNKQNLEPPAFQFPSLGFLHARSCLRQGADGRAHAVGAGRRRLYVAGIALTERRGAACVLVAADVARFWITWLHGPEANDWAVLRCLG